MTQQVLQSKREFTPSLIFWSMALEEFLLKSKLRRPSPSRLPRAARTKSRSSCLTPRGILSAGQMHKTDAEERAEGACVHAELPHITGEQSHITLRPPRFVAVR